MKMIFVAISATQVVCQTSFTSVIFALNNLNNYLYMNISFKSMIAAFVSTLAFGTAGMTAQTVTVNSTEVEETSEFKPQWFIQLQAGGAYTVGEGSFKDLISPSASAYVGYKFSPVLGLRFGVSGWQAKGAWVAPVEDYKFNYLQGDIDLMLSLTNLFCGYNPNRTLDFYGFVGFGGAFGFNNDEAQSLAPRGYDLEKLWTGTEFFPAGRAGLGLNINVSRSIALNLEVNTNMLPDKFNSKKGSTFDWQYNAMIGITYSFGRSKKQVAVVEETVIEEPVPAPEPAPEPEPAPVPTPVAPEPAPVVKPAAMTQNVFFMINSSFIRKSEQPKVDDIIEYMKAKPETKVVVTGYADKETGTAPYNMSLSKRRAEAVAAAIMKAGISADRISTAAKGDTVQPFEGRVKNRVAIAVAE